MKFVLLSDIHIGSTKEVPGRTPLSCLQAAVAHIRKRNADADFCIALGDLTETGAPEEYAILRKALSGLPMPCHLMIGNHDDRDRFKAAFPECPIDDMGNVQQVFDAGAFRFILLDTFWPGHGGGILDGGRLDWLDNQLAASPKPCLVFLHHPPFFTGVPAFEALSLQDRPDLEKVIGTHGAKVAGIFSGHCHMSVSGTVAGRPAFGMRSLFYQITQIFDRKEFANSFVSPPAYGVVLAQGESLTVHTVDLDMAAA